MSDISRYPHLRIDPMRVQAESAIKPVDVTVWFETDGSSNPSVFSPGVESVTRQTADTSSEPFYRVRLSKDTRGADASGSSYYSVLPGIMNTAAGVNLLPQVRTGLEVSSVGAVDDAEIDVALFDIDGSAFTNSVDGPRVVLRITYDALGGRL